MKIICPSCKAEKHILRWRKKHPYSDKQINGLMEDVSTIRVILDEELKLKAEIDKELSTLPEEKVMRLKALEQKLHFHKGRRKNLESRMNKYPPFYL